MTDWSPNRRQTIHVGAGAPFAQEGIMGFNRQTEPEVLLWRTS